MGSVMERTRKREAAREKKSVAATKAFFKDLDLEPIRKDLERRRSIIRERGEAASQRRTSILGG